mgnify:CR=1 FL=1
MSAPIVQHYTLPYWVCGRARRDELKLQVISNVTIMSAPIVQRHTPPYSPYWVWCGHRARRGWIEAVSIKVTIMSAPTIQRHMLPNYSPYWVWGANGGWIIKDSGNQSTVATGKLQYVSIVFSLDRVANRADKIQCGFFPILKINVP